MIQKVAWISGGTFLIPSIREENDNKNTLTFRQQTQKITKKN